jgi:hypothetical protein
VRQRQCAQVRRSFGVRKDCTGTRKSHQCHGEHIICICIGIQDPLVVRNNSVTCRRTSANIRDAVHPRLMRLERHTILRDDVAKPAPGLS